MDLELTKEHLMLQESAAYFIKKENPFERVRELKTDPLGYTKKIWKKMAKLDWMGLIYPEEYDGSEMDLSYVMVLLAEFGKGLLPEPWISTVLLGGNLVCLCGSESQKKEILPKIAAGKLFMTAAYLEEGGRYDTDYCATSALRQGDGFSISGKKIFVQDGCSADLFVVTARTSNDISDEDGITLFLLPKNMEGLSITPLKTMDGRNSCILELHNVQVKDSDALGEVDKGHPVLAEVIDQAAIGLCAEMIGGMETAINITVRHLTDRIQFGKPIGAFQATQHKAADMFIQKELATSAVYYATAAMVEKADDRILAVSTAKAKCSSAYVDICKTAVQLHGAFGFTNESDIALFIKRAKVTEILFGDKGYHLDRYARLKGYGM